MSKENRLQNIISRLAVLDPNLHIDESTFINVRTKARFFNDSGQEKWVKPLEVIYGKKLKFSNKISSEEMEQKIRDKFPHIFLDHANYNGATQKSRFVDEIYGEWWTRAYRVLKGFQHPGRVGKKPTQNQLTSNVQKISTNRKLPIEEVIKRLQLVSSYLTILPETYSGVSNKACFLDTEYNIQWWAETKKVLKGVEPPHRSGNKKLTANDVNKRIEKLGIRLVDSTYKSVMHKALFIDQKYGEWWVRPNDVFNGHLHPSRLKGGLEEKMSKLIDVKHFRQTLILDKKVLKPDFRLNENTFLEIDGLIWHSEKKKKDNDHHYKRRLIFEKHDNRIIMIRENELLYCPDVVKKIINKRDFKFSEHGRWLKANSNFFVQNSLKTTYLQSGLEELFYINASKDVEAGVKYEIKGNILRVFDFCGVGHINDFIINSFISCFSRITCVFIKFDLRFEVFSLPHGFELVSDKPEFLWVTRKQNILKINEEGIKKYKIFDAGQALYRKEL